MKLAVLVVAGGLLAMIAAAFAGTPTLSAACFDAGFAAGRLAEIRGKTMTVGEVATVRKMREECQ